MGQGARRAKAVKSKRRAWVIVGLLAVAVLGLGMLAWKPVYWWAMTDRVYIEKHLVPGGTVRGWMSVRKGTEDDWFGPNVLYYVDAGFKSEEALFRGSVEGRLSRVQYLEAVTRVTYWNPDGTVSCQFRPGPGMPALRMAPSANESRAAPPWWWGVTDQTDPMMPAWMKDDEKWQAALDAQR